MALALNLELPWSSSIDDDKRYNKILLVCIVVLLAVSVVVTVIKVPELARAEKEKLPPQLARVVLEKQELPPPKPIEPPKPEEKKPEEKKPEEKKPEPVEAKPEPKPVEKPRQPSKLPPKEAVERAREQAESQVSQFKDDLAEMREMMQTSAIETAATTVTNSTGEAAQVDRAMITSGAKVASGGINTAAMSRDTGGVALSGRETTKVKSGLAEAGKKTGAAKAGNSDGAGGAARSEEEIRKIMEQHKGAIYSIYNRALRQNPALQGKMVVKIVIDPNGRIVEASLVSSELGDSALESKILQRIKLITFPASNVARTTITQTFDFLPQ
ncbi:TonB family protein [Cellvibrio sp. KY-GH-1]|uniref:AgmX/PglI C-terminal domain-containing protein n=1 Tax=Cellvibrio sp. KY-GH-1 TaxID=2303332 RepID=UPI001248483C|nr:AgmX/PglI C-terminal domain-containing protein [Cellvibrio sp. KY-GH-1]QEY17853.1 TonB family protein [Cellvibrio sp. KY-GH-1]